MYHAVIKYYDIDDVEIEEEFDFALNKAEIVEIATSFGVTGEELEVQFKRVVKDKNISGLIDLFKLLLSKSVGKRNEEERILDKSEKITNHFMKSGAYPEMFMGLIQKPETAMEYFVNVVPASMRDELRETLDNPEASKDYTSDELLAMTDEEFDKVAGTDMRKMTKQQLQVATQRMMAAKAA